MRASAGSVACFGNIIRKAEGFDKRFRLHDEFNDRWETKVNENETFKRRIPSIDGGGILGAFPAAFPAGPERELDRPAGSCFDLIAGTSAGGILAPGPGAGMRASEIPELYENRGSDMFGGNRGTFANGNPASLSADVRGGLSERSRLGE